LLLTTGAEARSLPAYPGALRLRRLPDGLELLEQLVAGRPLQVVGAGFVGCEVAVAARRRSCQVTVHELLAQPLQRVLGRDLGAFLADVHRAHGVELRTGSPAPAGLRAPVLAAVGSEPRVELAAGAGLAVDGGILVDEYGATAVPDVFAAGDAARFWSPLFEDRVRVEHFQTAWRHGYATGRAVAGDAHPFAEAPWFWSDQYDLNLQYVGAGLPWEEEVVRGTIGAAPFTVFYLRAGKLVAAAGVNDRRTVAQARRLLETRAAVTRAQLEDPALELRRLAGHP
jgi:3-phenylpropionate/trans-cinnamate dioxygenase ferredoxin reductase subunit